MQNSCRIQSKSFFFRQNTYVVPNYSWEDDDDDPQENLDRDQDFSDINQDHKIFNQDHKVFNQDHNMSLNESEIALERKQSWQDAGYNCLWRSYSLPHLFKKTIKDDHDVQKVEKREVAEDDVDEEEEPEKRGSPPPRPTFFLGRQLSLTHPRKISQSFPTGKRQPPRQPKQQRECQQHPRKTSTENGEHPRKTIFDQDYYVVNLFKDDEAVLKMYVMALMIKIAVCQCGS